MCVRVHAKSWKSAHVLQTCNEVNSAERIWAGLV